MMATVTFSVVGGETEPAAMVPIRVIEDVPNGIVREEGKPLNVGVAMVTVSCPAT